MRVTEEHLHRMARRSDDGLPELPALRHQETRRVVHPYHRGSGIGWHAHVRRPSKSGTSTHNAIRGNEEITT